jgi:protein-tyrosine phosphatase
MARVLVVCTGNVCRSPIAEGLLRAALEAKLGDQAPSVASAGTMGWVGSGADPASVEAAAERGVDISTHRARELRSDEVLAADLVLAMARDHEDALADLAPTRTFTLKQLVRLLEALPAPGPGDPDAMLTARIADADDLRRNGFEGYPYDEDVTDPLGMPLESFRAIAWELDEWCGRLADGLFGRQPVRASADVEVD